MDQELRRIFRDGSTSYYYSSLFLPSGVKEDVFRLYAFVRTADDFVDSEPQDRQGFYSFREDTERALETGESDRKVIEALLEARENGIEDDWIEAFLDAMEMDLEKSRYETVDETLEYTYGSAEVIGLMMCEILDLDPGAKEPAQLMGRAMQYANFLRGVKEDNGLGRQYLPQEEVERHGLEDLSREEARGNPEKFREFMRAEIDRYRQWSDEARKGLKYIPYRSRVPVDLSSRLYRWTAERIEKRPLRVYEEKVRPSKTRIAYELLRSAV
ncbi:MAG: phytoene/squalene synthase family protein [Candidatus Nanohaloarchaea archaeon]